MTQHKKLNPTVFFISTLLLVLVVGYAVLLPSNASQFFASLQSQIVAHLSWYYVMVVALITISVAILTFSRYGDIKLGPDHSVPDYSSLSWFAMLFSAGMGIGLMFFGVAEPVMHFLSPPVGSANTINSAREAMSITFFHWGLHAWAIYAIVALILAYFSFRHSLPLTLRSALYPLIGERIYGKIGDAVDIFAIIGTVCGVATTLGFGVLQINAGLNHLFNIPVDRMVQVVLIVLTTGFATLSVVSGLDKGVKILSQINIVLAFALLIFVLALGPTVLILQSFVQNIGNYLSEIVNKTFNLYAYAPTNWLGGWTIFYWGWWLSWSPFVGLFIARISRGRTIREFVIGALLVPAGFTMLWMTVFGNSAINMIFHQGIQSLATMVQQDQSVALFVFLGHFPFSSLLSFIAIAMVLVFFVTSADSGAMVLNMLASHGRDDTPIWQRIYWSSLVGLVAITLLLAGGLKALQTATIASALPFSLILMAAIYGLFKALRIDSAKRESQLLTVTAPPVPGSESWQERLQNLLQFPSRSEVYDFMLDTAQPALKKFSKELVQHGVEAKVTTSSRKQLKLEAYHGEEIDFIYEVHSKAHTQPDESLMSTDSSTPGETYYRAEVHLREGGQDYDIMGWSQEQIIADLVAQYEKHLHFLHLMR